MTKRAFLPPLSVCRLVRISSHPPLQPSPSLSRHYHHHHRHHHGATMENLPPYATGRPLSRLAEQKEKQQKEAKEAPQQPEKKERKVDLLKRKKATGAPSASGRRAPASASGSASAGGGRLGGRSGRGGDVEEMEDVAEVNPEEELAKLLAKFRRVDELIKAAPEPQSREHQDRMSEVDRQYRVLSSMVCADAGKHFRTLDAMEHTLNDTEQFKSSVKKQRLADEKGKGETAGGGRDKVEAIPPRRKVKSSRGSKPSAAAPAAKPTKAAAAGPSYCLVSKSGRKPSVNHEPACRRLSREELANVFAYLQPWELARLRRHLGKALFHQSAANYTHLVIDCEDETARQMWAAMPLATAHKWGQRMTHLNRLRVRAPFDRPGWGLEVARIRTGRSWLTPNLSTLTFEREVDTEAAKEWVKGCKGLKELGMGGLSVRATEEVLRVLPEDGKSLSRLRSLGGIELWSADADAICRLRETLVARGAKGTLDFSSLQIIPPRDPSWHEYHQMVRDRNRIQELAELTADVVDADPLKEPIRRCRGSIGVIAAGLVTWAHQHRCPWVRYIVDYLASGAYKVVVSGDEGTAATITSDTFPLALTIEVAAGALATAEQRAVAARIGSVMPKLGSAEVGSFSSPLTSAVGVVDFLTALKSTENRIRVTVELYVSVAAVSSAQELSGWQLGRRAADMPPMWNVQFTVHGEVDDGECGALLCNAIAMLTSCTQLQGVDDVTMWFQSGLASKMRQWWERFRPEAPEGFDTEFSGRYLTFQRRSPSTK
ncbi:unnamed protein product [Vitrella brassicaformis CCMP3155]|uniref:Uncharacterized protein n=1 Tax=Vitrella brassicaformis (strain CCMP3155) TaxID=1169540 RepID=A0A0G4ERV9_VITBC|nr:unnamed protein product [Vitrella brassicaformis CCMP3155]|eukprot:CEM00956.1 unnamed protein product [Vitrella brassicaformis CCMP3155]